ncbi:MAG: ATP-binding protein [Verrucomicrobia bacterium]|nr:ATP-binding protein [Verrucomicrobiota bacterium]
MIERLLKNRLIEKLDDKKVIVLLGARQVGKTTLLNSIFSQKEQVQFLSGDDADTEALFRRANATFFKKNFAQTKFLIIDEAQRIKDIGVKLKLMADHVPGVKVLVSGSSAFDLANKIQEPLTGRKWEYQLHPVSFAEMVNHHGLLEEKRLLQSRLLYGYYPEVVTNPGREKEILKSLTDSFLYKDILQWEGIQKPQKLLTLLQALAYQVGHTVSFNELSIKVGLDKKTVEKYINLLEQTFVIFRMGSFSRNLRNELSNSSKYYFYDNGIRNALIAAFQPIENRMDIGALWENYMVAERKKYNDYNQQWCNTYFWRTHAQQEIDLIEEKDGLLYAFEIKWNPAAKARLSKTFSSQYPNHQFAVINNENYTAFLM